MIHLPRPQRQPANGSANAHTNPKANKGHQRRRVNRAPHHSIAGHNRRPGPAVIDLDPPPIMERRKPPGRFVHPGPAPWRHIAPAPMTIRHPAPLDRRIPDPAIFRCRHPFTTLNHSLVAGHLLHDLGRLIAAGCHHRLLPRHLRPQERIGRDGTGHTRETLSAGDRPALPGPHRHGHTGPRDLRQPLLHRHPGRLVGITRGNLIAAGLPDRHSATRRAHRDQLAGLNVAQPQIHLPLRRHSDELAVSQRLNIEFCCLIQRHPAPADLNIRRCVLLGPEGAAGCDGKVQRRRIPLRRPIAMKRNTAGQAGNAAHTTGRINDGGAGLAGDNRLVFRERRGEASHEQGCCQRCCGHPDRYFAHDTPLPPRCYFMNGNHGKTQSSRYVFYLICPVAEPP